jgi:hypothetical protein
MNETFTGDWRFCATRGRQPGFALPDDPDSDLTLSRGDNTPGFIHTRPSGAESMYLAWFGRNELARIMCAEIQSAANRRKAAGLEAPE